MGGVRLRRTLRTGDGLAMVVGIMVGSGIFRTPGIVATLLGRPGLTFLVWALGGAVGFLGALLFAELATRHPQAGGKYVYAREAFGRRGAFVVGWIEALSYCVAIAAIGVVSGEYLGRLLGWRSGQPRTLAAALVAFFTALNVLGVAVGRWAQNVATTAKVLALAGVVVAAAVAGTGAGWKGELPPHSTARHPGGHLPLPAAERRVPSGTALRAHRGLGTGARGRGRRDLRGPRGGAASGARPARRSCLAERQPFRDPARGFRPRPRRSRPTRAR